MKNSKYNIINKLVIAIAITLFFKIVFFRIDHFFELDLLFIISIVLIIWQGNEIIDKWLNKRYSWIENARKRLIIQSVLSVVFTSIALFVLMYILHQLRFGDGRIINRKMMEIFPPAILFTFALLAVKIGSEFFIALKNSLLEIEKHKTDSANAQLQNLKNQLNPHFLFNNLSVLTSLVHKNQDKAANFINELAKVYRYVLDTKNSELVPLQEELDFLNHYIYLLKIRFEDNIIFELNIDEGKKTAYLLPMCLQMLVENTIQHNETSQANPLKVLIYTQNNSLIIENPILPRSNVTDSTKMGLKNIEQRYSFFTDEKVIISNNAEVFKVILPLIQKKMKVVIIEDEKLSAEHLTVLLQKTDFAITVIKYFDTIKTSVAAFKEGLNADLIFMDIHLADGNSFEIFKQIELEIPVVFTTAFDNYAIQAFKQNSVDYLLKPIGLQDLQFAMEKFKKQKQFGNKDLISSIATAYQQLNKEYKTRFLVKLGQSIDTVKTEDIHHFETKESLSFLVTNKGNHHLIDYTLDQLETILQPKNFFRINRKIILHIQSIEKVNTYFNSRLSIATKFLDNDSRIVSRDRVNDFKKWLDN